MRVHTTFGQLVARLNHLVFNHLDAGAIRNQVCLRFRCFRVSYDYLTLFLSIADIDGTAKLRNNRKSLRLPCLKKLLDTRKTLCDIITRHTAGMEGSHGKLCTRLTDRLRGNNTDCLTNLDRRTGRHI